MSSMMDIKARLEALKKSRATEVELVTEPVKQEELEGGSDAGNIVPEPAAHDNSHIEQLYYDLNAALELKPVETPTHFSGFSLKDSLLSSTILIGEKVITLNERQMKAVEFAYSGVSFCLIGAAGTGKTTTVRKITQVLIESNTIPKLSTSTKSLNVGMHGIVIVAFTRKAANNIRRAVIPELRANVMTIHKLLEFQPEYEEVPDRDNPGMFKNIMMFRPARNASNPLPPEITCVIHEETSMEGVDLFNLLEDAMPHIHQSIFLGDIQQLPPVFGKAVLGFKLNELPVIELVEVHRQAMNSPVLSLAWKILGGNPYDFSGRFDKDPVTKRISVPALDALSYENEDGAVKFDYWQQSLSREMALKVIMRKMTRPEDGWIQTGYYNPDEDIILCPYNVEFGTIEINKLIMDYLGRARGATVHEVIAGFDKYYYAIGDRVLHDKEDAFIVDIEPNPAYLKRDYQTASVHLDRWGTQQAALSELELTLAAEQSESAALAAMDTYFDAAVVDEIEDRVHSCSHIITCRYADDPQGLNTFKIAKAGDFNGGKFLGGYCITVHKFQGSETDKVFIFLHSSHAKAAQRELLYTAVTRAKRFLHIICETNTFEKGIKSQKIIGNTLEEKAEQFKGLSKRGNENENLIPRKSQDRVISIPEERKEISREDDRSVETIPDVQTETESNQGNGGSSDNDPAGLAIIEPSREEKLAALRAKILGRK